MRAARPHSRQSRKFCNYLKMKILFSIVLLSIFNNTTTFDLNNDLSFEQQQYANFLKHENFHLNTSNWGSANAINITNLLDSVITEFYSNLDSGKINSLPVIVLNSLSRIPQIDYPMIIKEKYFTLIYLSTRDRFWAQYSYQFSHELCHLVIDTDFPPENSSFQWLEETLCELASLYTLNRMSITWQTNPPYPNWADYSYSLRDYVDNTISMPENNITELFYVWLANNLPDLYQDGYKRTENRIIAIHLLPIFTMLPELWRIIHYIKDIVITDNMTLEQYLYEWKRLIPPDLHLSFDIMTVFLVGKRM